VVHRQKIDHCIHCNHDNADLSEDEDGDLVCESCGHVIGDDAEVSAHVARMCFSNFGESLISFFRAWFTNARIVVMTTRTWNETRTAILFVKSVDILFQRRKTLWSSPTTR
jgi:hypothetical protein